MEHSLTKDGKTFVTHEEVVTTAYGIRVVDANEKNFITASNNILLDGYRVETNNYEKKWLVDLKALNKVPALYVVRTKHPTYRFVCGLDIVFISNEYWVGLNNTPSFKTMKEVISYLEAETKGRPFYISLEESFPI